MVVLSDTFFLDKKRHSWYPNSAWQPFSHEITGGEETGVSKLVPDTISPGNDVPKITLKFRSDIEYCSWEDCVPN